VEDAPSGIAAAHAAGMRAIGIPGIYGPEAIAAADVIAPRLGAIRVRSSDGRLAVTVG
jgi:beta-phosphoglucomutase-like phosphatase (HAD superfamily)